MRDINLGPLCALDEIKLLMELVDRIDRAQKTTTTIENGPYRPLAVVTDLNLCEHEPHYLDLAFGIGRRVIEGTFGDSSSDPNLLYVPWNHFQREKAPDAIRCGIAFAICRLTYQVSYEYARAPQAVDVLQRYADDNEYNDLAKPLALRWVYAKQHGPRVHNLDDETVLAAYAADVINDYELRDELLDSEKASAA